ncbi:GGDEF domain-containing protein [Microbacterium stercoris]|uniref:Diguanylate cyclase n=1 Tax=Microbacterium stercoris TaxID=2820289 RepID=A0A939QHN2_9MICO|nr:diguanylate cyclase [Microbacterium stercoris]MBO3662225.1 diguanylate cyclase [Microbacterium stercoris]
MTRVPDRATRPTTAARASVGAQIVALDVMSSSAWLCLLAAATSATGLAAGVASASEFGVVLAMICMLAPLSVALGWTVPPIAARIASLTVLLGVLSLAAAKGGFADARALWAIGTVLAVSLFGVEVSLQVRRRLRAALRTDPLTGLLNRRALRLAVPALLDEGAREQTSHWVIAIDLDGLKPINDRYGHGAGDRLLRECASAWTQALGRMGVVGRWGGDEFVVIVEAVDRGAARRMLRRLRAVTPHAFSAGLAPLTARRGLDVAVREADVQLYRDKRGEGSTRRQGQGVAAARAERVLHSSRAVQSVANDDWSAALVRAAVGAAAIVAVAAIPDLVQGAVALRVAAAADLAAGGLVLVAALKSGAALRRALVGLWVLITAFTVFARIVAATDMSSIAVSVTGVQILAILLAAYWHTATARGLFVAPALAAVAGIVVHALPGAPGTTISPTGAMGFGIAVIVAWALLEVVSAVRGRLLAFVHLDELTGALDRWGSEDRIGQLVQRSRRTGRPLTVVAIDFDRFKQLNDTHGHERGDDALRRAVADWRAQLRPEDVIGRIGGDEFVIALPDCDAVEAAHIVQRLRRSAADPWTSGTATVRGRETAGSLMRRADAVLGATKRLYRDAATRAEATRAQVTRAEATRAQVTRAEATRADDPEDGPAAPLRRTA